MIIVVGLVVLVVAVVVGVAAQADQRQPETATPDVIRAAGVSRHGAAPGDTRQ
jgi:hypothetical protein